MALTIAPAPTDTTNTWRNTFRKIDQEAFFPKFKNLLVDGATTATRISTACTADHTSFLIAQPNGTVKLVHHLHHDIGSAFLPGSKDIWGLYGADDTATPMIIPVAAFFTLPAVTVPSWAHFADCTSPDEIESVNRPDDNDKDEDKEDIFACSIVPVPAFLTGPILDSRSTDPAILAMAVLSQLRLTADIMSTRAMTPGAVSDPVPILANLRKEFGHIIQILWHVSSEITSHSKFAAGVHIDQGISLPIVAWSKLQHQTLIGRPLLTGPAANPPGSLEAFTHAIAAFQSGLSAVTSAQAAGGATPGTKATTTFETLPTMTRRLVLHASALETSGATRMTPLDSFTEILAFKNVSYVQTHLHHFLRSDPLALDIQVPHSLCTAIKTGTFVAENDTRPGIFSLFSCFSQQQTQGDLSEIELAQLNLKATESTTGLTDKDIAKLTKAYHHRPVDFTEVATLLRNMSGVTTLLFGAASRLSTFCADWAAWLSRGSIQPSLRSSTRNDHNLPSKVAWYFERSIQRYLNSCAESLSIHDVNLRPLACDGLKACLEEGRDYGLPICVALQSKAPPTPPPAHGTPPPGWPPHTQRALPQKVPPAAHDRNHKAIIPGFDISKDTWSDLLRNMSSCPIQEFCLNFHLRGHCSANCPRRSSHEPISDATSIANLSAWISECKSKGSSPNKKHTPSRSDVRTYSSTHSTSSCSPSLDHTLHTSTVPTVALCPADLTFLKQKKIPTDISNLFGPRIVTPPKHPTTPPKGKTHHVSFANPIAHVQPPVS